MSPERVAEAGRAILTNLLMVVLCVASAVVALAAIFHGAVQPFWAAVTAAVAALIVGKCVTRVRTIMRYGL